MTPITRWSLRLWWYIILLLLLLNLVALLKSLVSRWILLRIGVTTLIVSLEVSIVYNEIVVLRHILFQSEVLS